MDIKIQGAFGSRPKDAVPRHTFRAAVVACVCFAAPVAACRRLAMVVQFILDAKSCRSCGGRFLRRTFGMPQTRCGIFWTSSKRALRQLAHPVAGSVEYAAYCLGDDDGHLVNIAWILQAASGHMQSSDSRRLYLKIVGMLKSRFFRLPQIRQAIAILIIPRHELSQGALNEAALRGKTKAILD